MIQELSKKSVSQLLDLGFTHKATSDIKVIYHDTVENFVEGQAHEYSDGLELNNLLVGVFIPP